MLDRLKTLGLDIGLYRDDGLGVSSSTNRQLENMKKKLCEIFKQEGLSITVEANKKEVNFLDVTLDLRTGLYKPFIKPNDIPLYVHKLSNHPPSIIENLPAGINKRLSSLSANEEIFNQAVPIYQEALRKSGYEYKLKFEAPPKNPSPPRKRKTQEKSPGSTHHLTAR